MRRPPRSPQSDPQPLDYAGLAAPRPPREFPRSFWWVMLAIAILALIALGWGCIWSMDFD